MCRNLDSSDDDAPTAYKTSFASTPRNFEMTNDQNILETCVLKNNVSMMRSWKKFARAGLNPPNHYTRRNSCSILNLRLDFSLGEPAREFLNLQFTLSNLDCGA